LPQQALIAYLALAVFAGLIIRARRHAV